ncbi:CRISPR-associated helicase Cas3' [Archaeoglobus neptunius]|uniref:CRISPR-associated helicase Cas3' n=1 Tax=Archaeoglobus neptunius TaxID=2798580 RepID=UPI001925F51A|nr:CRISPR-associated helicase Cas3' [Archaeoglobus neptunius]
MESLKDRIFAKLELKNGEKYFQTLEGHTTDALKILKAYIQQNYDVIAQFCDRRELNKEKFLRNLFLTVYLHDIGKLTKEFQENIRQNRRSQKYPHAYYGFFLLYESFTDTIIEIPIELAAILGHHTQLYDQLYSDHNQFERPTFLVNEIKEFVNNATKIYTELGFNEFFVFNGFDIVVHESRPRPKVVNKVRNEFVKRINEFVDENRNWERTKSIFSYFFAVLQICDDYASAHFSKFVESYNGEQRLFDSVLENPDEYVPFLKVDDPIKKVLGDKDPYKFQKDLLDAPKFVTLFAPCGRGKTEAALLWALNALEKYRRNKIVFAMPTQTTSNAMYDRLKAIFGEENVGLYHGRCFIKLRDDLKKETDEDFEEEKDVEEIRSETFKGNTFFKPITITTVDHLIYSFVKGFSQADFALGNLQNAVIIFDEVHYYEKLTLEHLLTLFNLLTKMDIPHLLMSGTLPDFMLKELDNCYRHIVDKEGLEFIPFKLELHGRPMFDDDVVNEIVENYRKGLTQFTILNTVERAKQFYLRLKEELKNSDEPNIMLYHSQFTYNDRVKKENEIYSRIKNKPFILVATQVIEISLDISCDVMYSELAPPDALGQRAGRLNRKGREWSNEFEHVLKIYTPEKHLPYEEDLFNKVQLNVRDYQKPMSYKEVKEFCDRVYADYTLEIPSDLLSLFRKCAVFGYNWKDITFDGEEGRIFRVRDEKIQYVDVIPECIYEKEGEKALRVENMAKIPLYYLLEDIRRGLGYFYPKEIKKGRKIKVYWICRYPYSYEIGFENRGDEEFTIL